MADGGASERGRAPGPPRLRVVRGRFRPTVPAAGLAAGFAGLVAGLSAASSPSAGAAGRQPPEIRFVETTADSGVSFRHDPGDLAAYPLPVITGAGGAALFDADGDGDLDLYLIQSGPLPETRADDSAPELPGNRLFLRQPDGSFRDATESSGLGDTGYGNGVAVGDADGDGDPDVFLANYGADRLYRNEGGGRFTLAEDAFPPAASRDNEAPGGRWSTAAAFCDMDGDTDLDLYVGGYLTGDATRECVSASGERDFCSPQSFDYERDTLWRNVGGGKFEDASEPLGIAGARLPALGILCHDFTGDGRPDFYVANDGEENLLWEQREDGAFRDAALFLGVALNGQGRAEASMGVALGDSDGDGDLDLFMTHVRAQSNTFYRSLGDGAFRDDTPAAGLGVPSLRLTGFGTQFADFDLDGDLDLALVNGAVAREGGVAASGELTEYAEPAQVFAGDGAGVFTEVEAGDFTALVRRGAGPRRRRLGSGRRPRPGGHRGRRPGAALREPFGSGRGFPGRPPGGVLPFRSGGGGYLGVRRRRFARAPGPAGGRFPDQQRTGCPLRPADGGRDRGSARPLAGRRSGALSRAGARFLRDRRPRPRSVGRRSGSVTTGGPVSRPARPGEAAA